LSTGKNLIVYCDSDVEEKIWSGYASKAEPDKKNIAGSTPEVLSLQQEQFPYWAC
jgi:hypothetical protein